MKILFISFYYQPDLSAGSFRNTALVTALKNQLPKNSTIEVITTLPSRYASFNPKASKLEKKENIIIHRIKLPKHKSGFMDQSFAFILFGYKALKIVRSNNYDLVYASSSRLMTAALGTMISKWKKTLLYLDIRDIFIDTLKNVFPVSLSRVLVPLLYYLEKWTISKAQRVNLVSPGFRKYFETYYPEVNLSFFLNGIDADFLIPTTQLKNNVIKSQLEVVYAGNFGEGQGLDLIIPDLAKHFKNRIKFTLLGDGSRKGVLEKKLESQEIKNVKIILPVERSELINIYKNADILFLHLNKYDAFKKVLPSKIFEYASMGKPIWAGVSGFAADFLNKNVRNAVTFKPCDFKQAVNSFKKLELQTHSRKDFISKFSREIIMTEMSKDILNVIETYRR